jgi:hypothetical protein
MDTHMIDTYIDPLDIVGGKPQEWWLYGPTWLRGPGRSFFVMTLRALPILIVTFVFYWATEAHPNWAVTLGALLADFLIVTRGRKLLRGFVAWILFCVIYLALTTSHPHPASIAAASTTGSYHSADSSTLSLPPVWPRHQQQPRH